MDIKTWDELRKPDERTLHFTPVGLGGRMRPEDSARYWQEVMAGFERGYRAPGPGRKRLPSPVLSSRLPLRPQPARPQCAPLRRHRMDRAGPHPSGVSV